MMDFSQPTRRRSQFSDVVEYNSDRVGRMDYGLGANISTAALHNRRLLLHEIRARGTADCTALAKLTGLTLPAVYKIMKDLTREQWIVSSVIKDGSRGQPTSTLSINPNFAFSLGLNMDRDRMTLVALDFAGGIRARIHHEGAPTTPEEAKHFVDKAIGQIRNKRLFPIHKIAGAGLSIPDDYRPDASADGEGRPGPDWRSAFRSIDYVPLARENDAASACIGEMLFGAGLKVDTFFYLYISVGLGGGLVVNRQYIRGRHGRSGEVGYMPQVNPFRQRNTSLGVKIEEIVSLPGLYRRLDIAGAPEECLSRLNTCVVAEDGRIDDWISAASDLLYLPLLSVLCALDPDAICVGGRLPGALTQKLCVSLSRRLSMNVGVHWPEMAVRPGHLDEDVSAVGAAILGLSAIWDKRED